MNEDTTPTQHHDLWARRSEDIRLALQQTIARYQVIADRKLACRQLPVVWRSDDWWFLSLVWFCGAIWGVLALIAWLEWRGIL